MNGEVVTPVNAETASPADTEAAAPADAKTAAPNGSEPTVPANAKATPKRHRRRKGKSGTSTTTQKSPKEIYFVHFQQTLLREKLKTISEEEAAAVDSHIETTYAAALKVWECPWYDPSRTDKTEEELKMEHYEK